MPNTTIKKKVQLARNKAKVTRIKVALKKLSPRTVNSLAMALKHKVATAKKKARDYLLTVHFGDNNVISTTAPGNGS